MSRTFKVWLDSGANIHSRYEAEVSLDDLGLTSEEFDALSDDEIDEAFREFAFAKSDWGWAEE